ncbi:MAG: hypothetical protein KAX20_04880 [Candidatus Omnitrophica bacterium]|nr:hypothetical protein [Candidatus Omnitrophota bacterium]
MKLSKKQQEVVELLKKGWELGCFGAYGTGCRLQEGGLGKGGEAKNFSSATIRALYDKGLIIQKDNSINPPYILKNLSVEEVVKLSEDYDLYIEGFSCFDTMKKNDKREKWYNEVFLKFSEEKQEKHQEYWREMRNKLDVIIPLIRELKDWVYERNTKGGK